MRIIAGLGNPGKEYEETRHNAGRLVLEEFRQKNKLADWSFDKKLNALISPGIIKKNKVLLVWPETFMNKSGLALKKIIVSKKKAADLIIVHDDLDLPLGKFKISFGKNSGGHKGVESIQAGKLIRQLADPKLTSIWIFLPEDLNPRNLKK
ncbi:MAG: Peptidyl-tRNA hydrolase [Parcubacteria group bacterium GW2011_GWB1_41_6]|nr:MAG: Peptidyl-tRNA hydrolase [Parcubacteria group bacterium GW2011_GWB1_41_6]